MKKPLLFLLVLLWSSILFAQENILAQVDKIVSFLDSDFSAEYTIKTEKPAEGSTIQTAYVLRRDKENKFTIILLSPPVDKNKAYLKIGNNLWLYDPVGKKFIVTSAKDRFQNSNARNSDFTSSTLAKDYKIVKTSNEKYLDYDCSVLDLEAVTDSVTFPKMKIWIDGQKLVRKYQDFSFSGQLLRTTIIEGYNMLNGRAIPKKIIVSDELKGKKIKDVIVHETTTISISKPSQKALPDRVFTQAYLEQVAK